MPSGASATVRTTAAGSSICTAFSSTKVTVTVVFSTRKFLASPTISGGRLIVSNVSGSENTKSSPSL